MTRALLLLSATTWLLGCTPKSQPPPQQPATYYNPGGPPPQYGYGASPQPQPGPVGTAPQPQPTPIPAPTPPALLPPLYGVQAEQAETRAIIDEVIAVLPADRAEKVRGIPLVWDPTLEPNAYAGCDDNGAPFIAGTQGLLDAVDAIAQTQASDELFGTHTYDAYMAQAAPRLLQQQSVGLPAGTIPDQYWSDARRFSRAHEMFDQTIAFTFGHELGHHYLGHTGCANGQSVGLGPAPALLNHLLTNILPAFNQPNELAADNVGVLTLLDAGLARQSRALYRWNEQGAYALLDFFGRVEKQAGMNPFSPVAFLRTHPSSSIRLPAVQLATNYWYSQHPRR